MDALISLALRACREADKKDGEHNDAWKRFEPTFDLQIAKADSGDYEFITLVANYLPQFAYMSNTWIQDNLSNIFDKQNYQKWLCAMQGYTYVNIVYQEFYEFLKDNRHIENALDDGNLKERTSDKLIQNVVLAFLNGWESIDSHSSLLMRLVSRAKYSEMSQLIWFVWTQRREGDAELSSKVVKLWPLVLGAIDTNESEGRKIASKLCDWAVFVEEVTDETRPLLLAVMAFADEEYNSYGLLEYIASLAKTQPKEAYLIWDRLLDGSQPDYPEEAISTALLNLADSGQEGVRHAKLIVSRYLEAANDKPHLLLENILSSPS